MQSREPYGREEGFRKVTLPLRIWAIERSIARAKTEDKQANMLAYTLMHLKTPTQTTQIHAIHKMIFTHSNAPKTALLQI